jgi:drug/metabolite transporter (DMT)-like permease
MNKHSLIYVIISASLFGSSTPIAKLLVEDIPPVILAGILYLGAFLGLFVLHVSKRILNIEKKIHLKKPDIPWLAGAILTGGVLGPICLMTGLTLVSGFTASLLLNLEGIATALIAILFFKEYTGKRFWLVLCCMTLAGIFLTWDPNLGQFNVRGPIFVVLAMIFWGLDNNLTRKISDKDPSFIAMLKGLIGGIISISVAFYFGMRISLNWTIFFALLLGAFSYGVSLIFFIRALQGLGAARTGAFFTLGPFIGAIVSILLLNEWIGWVMYPGTGLMIIGVLLIVSESHSHKHKHERLTHEHYHWHDDGHHLHKHRKKIRGHHIHEHSHDEVIHVHSHWPDTHHRHSH